jgi:DNA-binding NtrC family response regulator
LKYFSRINRKNIEEITPEAMNVLAQYKWPGNVRELKNIIERMVVLSNGKVIDLEQIPDDIKRLDPIYPKLSSAAPAPIQASQNIQEMEKAMIIESLRMANQNKSVAAKKLGISRRTLYRKLQEYGIESKP